MGDRLYRSRRDRVIGGLAAGMARGLGVDATWVRLGWVVLAFATQGLAVLVYIVLLFVVPEAPEGAEADVGTAAAAGSTDAGSLGTSAGRVDDATAAGEDAAADTATPRFRSRSAPGGFLFVDTGRRGSQSAALIVGLLLVAAGAWLLLRRFVLIDFDLGWPVVAIAIGAILIAASLRTGRSG